MPAISQLPNGLEDVDALMKRENKSYVRKCIWQSLYQEGFRYAMPSRDTFSEYSPGSEKASRLYDSTLQQCTYEAANTMVANLFPPWMVWAALAPGGAFTSLPEVPQNVLIGLQRATEKFYQFINHSNFTSAIHEVALDLLAGTACLNFEESADPENPFVFQAVPLSVLQIEEGPDGTVENTWMRRKPRLDHLQRIYSGMDLIDWPSTLVQKLQDKPDEEVEIRQGILYDPTSKRYFGVAILVEGKVIIWRFDYGQSCPDIVARATKVAGECYGRGRILLALPDARTLDKMVEFVLRQAALQIAPPMTGVSDGVLNPYTASVQPAVVIPVASNDSGNPSLRVLEVGGDFGITQEMIAALRERVRRTMLGPEYSVGPIKTATEITKADRDRLWAMNGEYSRIQAELLAKVVKRGVYILQKNGVIPKFKINGQEVSVVYNSPFARSQSNEDLMALQTTLELVNLVPGGPQIAATGYKTELLPRWIAGKTGLDPTLVCSTEDQQERAKAAATAAAEAMKNGVEVPQGA